MLKEFYMAQEKRTALITGSGKNIGRGVALHLAESGYNVVLNGSRDRNACEEVAEKIRGFGSEALIEMCDIGERDKVLAMAQSAIEKFGSVDVLVNNAAVRPDGGFLTISEAEWNRVYDTNFNSAFHLARACLPGMIAKKWGRIIHFTGMHAQQGYAGKAAVSASKHALWGMTKTLSKEFGRQGVTTNIISPGTFPDVDADASSPRFQGLLKANPSGRLGTADDIAAMVDLLVSENGGFINGQMLQVNGGVINQF
jgi:3-oxoacyl-[acyl-carrier protein] reductase